MSTTLSRSTRNELTDAQKARIDQIDLTSDENKEARVVGWDERANGPLLVFPDGRRRAISTDGTLAQRGRTRVAR